MPTYDKNIHYLKEAVFTLLDTDTTLKTLLGGNDRIYHKNIPKEAIYPCIIYEIINDTENPYNETKIDGQVTRANIRLTIFSNDSQTEITDNIEARIKNLLHGQRTLDTTKIICYSCVRDFLGESIKDPNLLVWITPIRYRVTWATK